MISRTVGRWLGGALVAIGLLVLAADGVTAQTTTGTIRGYITAEGGGALATAEITARNPETGAVRSTTSRADGFYVLPGLNPALYEVSVRHIGNAPQARRVRVQIGATAIENFALSAQPIELEEVTAIAAAPAVETRTSEVATNVTTEQIERLPTPSRNFLDLAALAPGVSVAEDRVNGQSRNFSSGGQPATATNIFIDGTSLKNDLTGGGVTGQDASRGNPFPRNAIQEYRVLSQNFKAEYQKSSSSVITATTKSGGNTWSGSAFLSYQDKGLIGLDSFQIRDKNNSPGTFKEPEYSRYLLGISAGGPLIKDKLHIFGSYEGNYQDRQNRVTMTPTPTGFPALDSVNLSSYNGAFTSPFRESLFFGKLSYAVSPKSTAELSFSNRHETDERDFGGTRSFQSAVNFRNKVSIGQLRYNFFSGPWLNEFKVDLSRFQRNPSPNTPGLASRIYQYNNTDNRIGSDLSTQDFVQKRLGFRNDVTYSGFQAGGQHVLKAGVSVDFADYDIVKDNDGTPRFMYRDSVNGQSYAFRSPYQLFYGTGNPNLQQKNNQIGLYLQDDWSPTSRLTFNFGVRWDYETNMINTDYKTPQNVIDTLTRYNDSLPSPLNLNRYISTGSNRSPFGGAIQPRLGFSYALDEDNKTTIFGGFGIYYDRTLFDISVDETLKLSHPTYTINFAHPDSVPGPGEVAWNDSYLTSNRAVLDQLTGTFGVPEAWLIDKDIKTPKSRQWNLGVRRVFGDFNVSATYAGVRGVDQVTLNWANFGLNPDGSCCTSFNLATHGFSNFIYSTNDGKTWYDALQLQVDRPYRRSSESFGWGAGLAVTYAERSVQGVDGLGDLFAFPNTRNIPKHPANDEKTRVVANWIMDMPFLYGIQFGGLITLGSGSRSDVGCPVRFCGAGYERGGFTPKRYNFIVPGAWAYRMVDLRVRKDFPSFRGTTLGITADLFNAFNFQNFGCFNTGSKTDPNFGKASCVVSDARRFQLGMEYNF